jgi:DNA-binding HxlR family transcriptional regulator
MVRFPPDVLSSRCPSRRVLDLIADKWVVLVIYALGDETRRYSDLTKQIDGISQKMLTQTLRHLESHGLVKRTVYPVVPPHVTYALTARGRSLRAPLRGLCRWAEENLPAAEILPSRTRESGSMARRRSEATEA